MTGRRPIEIWERASVRCVFRLLWACTLRRGSSEKDWQIVPGTKNGGILRMSEMRSDQRFTRRERQMDGMPS